MDKMEEWGENPRVIICIPKRDARYIEETAVIRNCEICEQQIYCSPISAKKVQEDGSWHLMCNDCVLEIKKISKKEAKIVGYVGLEEIEEFPEGEDLETSFTSARIRKLLDDIKIVPVKPDIVDYAKKPKRRD